MITREGGNMNEAGVDFFSAVRDAARHFVERVGANVQTLHVVDASDGEAARRRQTQRVAECAAVQRAHGANVSRVDVGEAESTGAARARVRFPTRRALLRASRMTNLRAAPSLA